MSRLPFPISDNWSNARPQIEELIRILFEERIGGLEKGDYINGEDEAKLTDAWEDLRVPVNAVRVSGSKPPTWSDGDAMSLLKFSDQALEGNEEKIYFTVQLPHSYKEGTDIYPHVHWMPPDATDADVAWKLTYNWSNIGDTFSTTAQTSTIIANTGAKAWKHSMASFPKLSGKGKKISSMITCMLQRNSSNASDTYTSTDAYFMEIDFHYQVDSNGSRQEKVK